MLPIILEFKGSLLALLGERRQELVLETPLTVQELETLMLTLYPVLREERSETTNIVTRPALCCTVNGLTAPRIQMLTDADVVQVYATGDASLPLEAEA